MTAEPFPLSDEQHATLKYRKRRRAIINAVAASDSQHYGARIARKLIASDRRSPDTPIDLARRTLQRRGRIVFNASVTGGRRDRWMVDYREVTADELLRMAGV